MFLPISVLFTNFIINTYSVTWYPSHIQICKPKDTNTCECIDYTYQEALNQICENWLQPSQGLWINALCPDQTTINMNHFNILSKYWRHND